MKAMAEAEREAESMSDVPEEKAEEELRRCNRCFTWVYAVDMEYHRPRCVNSVTPIGE